MLKKASAQVHRAGEIVGRLRRFIGKQETDRAAENVEALVQDAVSLLGGLGDGIQLRTEIAPDLPVILADRVQIQQVLVNLARNAIEAMTGQDRRDLRITAILQGPDAVRLSVADTGPGLPELVTANLADYEALALRLASDPGALQAIKGKLACNRSTCPLFDTARFTRHLEAAYIEMWERWRRGEAPAHIDAAPVGAG